MYPYRCKEHAPQGDHSPEAAVPTTSSTHIPQDWYPLVPFTENSFLTSALTR